MEMSGLGNVQIPCEYVSLCVYLYMRMYVFVRYTNIRDITLHDYIIHVYVYVYA